MTTDDVSTYKNLIIHSFNDVVSCARFEFPAVNKKISSFFQLGPDGAPQNVRGYSTSSTSILVLWNEVPANQQNGIITGYTITYHSQTENHNANVSVGPNDRQKNITGLKEYVDYNITVFASTVKGNGPQSSPVLVVRTDQDSKQISVVKLPPFC